MDDRHPLWPQQAASAERVERGAEQARPPAIEQIAGQHQVIGTAGDDAVKLSLERAQIVRVAHVRIGEVGDDHDRLDARLAFKLRTG